MQLQEKSHLNKAPLFFLQILKLIQDVFNSKGIEREIAAGLKIFCATEKIQYFKDVMHACVKSY